MRCRRGVDARFAAMGDVVRALDGGGARSAPPSPSPGSPVHESRTPRTLTPTHASRHAASSPTDRSPRRSVAIALTAVGAIASLALLVGYRTRGARRASTLDAPLVASGSATPSPPLREGDWVERRLTAFAPENRVAALAVSADGATIAYADVDGVWTAPVAGGARRAVPCPRKSARLDPS